MLSLKKIAGCVATVGVVLMLASTALASAAGLVLGQFQR